MHPVHPPHVCLASTGILVPASPFLMHSLCRKQMHIRGLVFMLLVKSVSLRISWEVGREIIFGWKPTFHA
jgi:hypothetical protein